MCSGACYTFCLKVSSPCLWNWWLINLWTAEVVRKERWIAMEKQEAVTEQQVPLQWQLGVPWQQWLEVSWPEFCREGEVNAIHHHEAVKP